MKFWQTGISKLPVFGELDSELWYVWSLEDMEIRFFPSFTAAGPVTDGVLNHVSLVLSRPPLTDNLEEKVQAMLAALTEAFGEAEYEEQEVEEPGSGSPYTSRMYEWEAEAGENVRNLLLLAVDVIEDTPVRVSLELFNVSTS